MERRRRLHGLTKLRKLVEGLPQFSGELGIDVEQVSPERLLERRRTTPPAWANTNASAVETVEVIAYLVAFERELRKLARIGLLRRQRDAMGRERGAVGVLRTRWGGASSGAGSDQVQRGQGAAPVASVGLQGMIGHHRMDDAAYKRLFSRPGMVRDLLRGFAARDWSGALDFTSLTPLPASYVSRDLQQRYGDLVWRIRFGGERWLYLLLLLEFQSGVDRAMAVRMLTYSGLLYQRLVGEGVLRERGALPPVLPVVIYNGRSPWTAPEDVSELIAAGGAALARYQPSQQYFLLDEGRVDGGSLPPGNLVSALIALETNRDRARLPALLETLIGLLRAQDDEELTDAFTAWAEQVLLPRPLRGTSSAPLPRLEEVRTMLAETVREWTEQWVEQGLERGIEQGRAQGIEQGRAQGIEQGRVEERALLCRQAACKFDAAAGQQLAAALADVTDPGRLAQVGEWIIECRTAADLFARLDDTPRRSQ